MSRTVVVAGGGLAGITAALRCADAGQRVVLVEARAGLGGLTHSFQRDGLAVDNGQHVFLRCCTAYLRLLDRLGVTGDTVLQSRLDIQVRVPGGVRARIRRNGLPAPLHLGNSLLGYRALGVPDRLRVVRGALALRRVDATDPAIDDVNFGDWLLAHGQNDKTIAALWDLFTIATINLPAAQSSLALAAKVFQTGLFTDSTAGDIGWSKVPLQQLHGDAALQSLHAAGATVLTKTKLTAIATALDPLEGSAGSTAFELAFSDGTTLTADQVILALPPQACEQLLPGGAIAQEPGWSTQLGSSPIVNAHVVYDRCVLDEPFFAGVNSPIQWAFDRSEQAGLPPGHYLAVSLSAAEAYIDVPVAGIRTVVLPALADLLPLARGAQVSDFFVSRERHATFRGVPGSARLRPASRTRVPGLALAGAWTDTGWPATMESAVLSGEAAAAVVLSNGTPLHNSPDPLGQKGTVAA